MRITKDPAIRRQEIIDTARELFEAQGISKTSMTDIAQKIGVAKGLVYYYFSSKDLLVEEVIDQFIRHLDETLRQILLRDDLDFYGKLSAILILYFQSFQGSPALIKFSPVVPGVFDLIRDRMSETALIHASDLLQQGKQDNLIRIEYPEYMLKILISGLGDLYIQGVRELPVHATLIEQTLGLAKGRLTLG